MGPNALCLAHRDRSQSEAFASAQQVLFWSETSANLSLAVPPTSFGMEVLVSQFLVRLDISGMERSAQFRFSTARLVLIGMVSHALLLLTAALPAQYGMDNSVLPTQLSALQAHTGMASLAL